MPLPRWLAGVNRSFTNRLLSNLPRRFTPFVILHHTGRSTARRYSVPLAAFQRGDGIVLTPTYGLEADWVKNVLAAGELDLVHRSLGGHYTGVRVIGRSEAWPHLPALVRVAMRLMRIEWFVAADRSVVAERDGLDRDLL